MLLGSIFGFVGIALILFAVLWRYRIEWVYKERIKIINESFHTYDDYLSFGEMMNRIWIWDINKLKKERK